MTGNARADEQQADERQDANQTAAWPPAWWPEMQASWTQLVVVFTASGYLVGYLCTRLFAAGLGVSMTDVGLSTQDYFLCALVWLVIGIGVVFIGMVPLSDAMLREMSVDSPQERRLWERLRGVLGIVGALVVFSLLSGERNPLTARGYAILQILAIALLIGFAARRWTTALLPLLLGVVISGGFYASYSWGRDLRDGTKDEFRSGPVWLAVVISEEPGIAPDEQNGEECLVRIADRISIHDDVVTVFAEPFKFTAGCRH